MSVRLLTMLYNRHPVSLQPVSRHDSSIYILFNDFTMRSVRAFANSSK